MLYIYSMRYRHYLSGILLLLLAPALNAQRQHKKNDRREDSTIAAMRGRLLLPLAHFTDRVGFGLRRKDALNWYNPGISFITDGPAYIRCSWAGTVAAVSELDGAWLLIVKTGTIYLSYYGLSNCSLQRGDQVRQGQLLGQLIRTAEGAYTLDFLLTCKEKMIDPEPWLAPAGCGEADAAIL